MEILNIKTDFNCGGSTTQNIDGGVSNYHGVGPVKIILGGGNTNIPLGEFLGGATGTYPMGGFSGT